MTVSTRKSRKTWLLLAGGAALASLGVVTAVTMISGTASPVVASPSQVPAVRLVPGSTDKLVLSPQLINTLGVHTAAVQSAASHERLKLAGSLFLDSNRLVRVHSRFAGEVVSIGENRPVDPSATKVVRSLRLGDRVTKGQLLAVIWSKDIGDTKSDLVNALSKLYLDEAQLKNLKSLRDDVARRQVREAERAREADIIEVDRVERTLRSWRLADAEINAVRAEAEKIHRGDMADRDADRDAGTTWAEVEVRSPFDGVVLEKNIVAGDIVDTSLDLFKIADLSVLGVLANVYEEDLPALESFAPSDRRWTVHLRSQADAPGIEGSFELIGNIVDPNQHTAAVMGWLDNTAGRLRAGQFITAIVELPASAGEVVVPDTALVQEGSSCVVFVASDEAGSEVTRRRVALASRGQDVVYIRSRPSPEESSKGCKPLEAGEWVVTSGSIELDGALENALAAVERPSAVN
jgi:cobalt-zinc-cadmium efflux system membrane fusion protein